MSLLECRWRLSGRGLLCCPSLTVGPLPWPLACNQMGRTPHVLAISHLFTKCFECFLGCCVCEKKPNNGRAVVDPNPDSQRWEWRVAKSPGTLEVPVFARLHNLK